jgi:hypothetical protein
VAAVGEAIISTKPTWPVVALSVVSVKLAVAAPEPKSKAKVPLLAVTLNGRITPSEGTGGEDYMKTDILFQKTLFDLRRDPTAAAPGLR